MAFSKGLTSEIPAISAGVIQNREASVILSAQEFGDLEAGLFVKFEAGSLEKVDGSADPELVGVALRDLGASFPAALSPDVVQSYSEYAYKGLVTVTVKADEAPAVHGDVFVSNAGDADDGKATATGTDLATSAKFIQEKKPVTATQDGVWLVYVG